MTAETHTHAGTMMGTIGYMSPEQARGLPADARSDLFAFGVVLYEMLSGRRAFQGETSSDTLAAILTKDPSPLPSVTPPGLDRIVRRCLEKRPEDRFSTAHDVALALEAVSTSGEPAPADLRLAAWLTRQRRVAWIALSGILVLAVAGVLVLKFKYASPSTGAAGPGQIRSIAVLPLANLSGDTSQEYFSDGMTEELITHLSKISALKVISRTSVMRFKGTQMPLREIAEALDVDGIVEGSVMRAGERVRITAQLIDASTDAHLWAESYERDIKDVLGLQGEVARTIAHAVNVVLSPEEQTRLLSARPVVPEAYEAFLKGLHHWYNLTPGDLDAALKYFERALEADPEYAAAHAGIAIVWTGRQQMGLTPAREAALKAREAARKAVELDDTAAEAHTSLAGVLAWGEWDWAGAEAEYRRAIELNPNLPDAHAFYSHVLMHLRRPEEVMPQMQRALELDPFNPMFHALSAWDLLYLRRNDEALAQAKKALTIEPNHPVARWALYSSYVASGMFQEAFDMDRQGTAADPAVLAALERGWAESGFTGSQKRLAEALAVRYGRPGLKATSIAYAFGIGKDRDGMFRWLERALQDRDPNLPYVECWPLPDEIRADPRYGDLLRRMNLPVNQ
jgi:TolB-like protein/Tfp pilus assembly protein PilF